MTVPRHEREGRETFFHEIAGPELRTTYVLGYGGEALVIDFAHDVDSYLDAARAQGARVRYLLETEAADTFAEARDELVRRTGAASLGPRAGEGSSSATLRSGDALRLGSLCILAFTPPGESGARLAYAISDESRSPTTVTVVGGVVEEAGVLV